MLQVLALIIPFGLAGAVSPVMLTEQTILLAGTDGRRSATRYAAGAAAVLLVFVGALILFGRAVSLPQEPTLDATLDFVIGGLLLAAALLIHHRRPREPRPAHPGRTLGPHQALGFGAFSMATNFTTLAFVVPGAKVIAASDLGLVGRTLAVAVLVGLASTPAWLPIALTRVAPGPAARGLGALRGLIERRGRIITVLFLAGLGLLLVVHGLVGLPALG